jgi:hydroxymethylglutaryl-CoA reductase
MVMAAVGMASNLAALRAMASEGIQRGHMSLHARSVALGVGTPADLIDAVADELAKSRDVRPERAIAILEQLRRRLSNPTEGGQPC